MIQTDLMSATRDAGRIRLGGVFRLAPAAAPALPPAAPATQAALPMASGTVDTGRIRLGGVFRLPAIR